MSGKSLDGIDLDTETREILIDELNKALERSRPKEIPFQYKTMLFVKRVLKRSIETESEQ